MLFTAAPIKLTSVSSIVYQMERAGLPSGQPLINNPRIMVNEFSLINLRFPPVRFPIRGRRSGIRDRITFKAHNKMI